MDLSKLDPSSKPLRPVLSCCCRCARVDGASFIRLQQCELPKDMS